MTPQTVRVRGAEVAYRRSRGRGRTVVLVHGNSSSSATWTPLLDGEFGERFACVALDLPGHGGSAPPAAGADDYAVPGYSATIAEFAGALGVRDAVFVGWSLGGNALVEAAPLLGAEPAGYAVFGTPAVRDGASFAEAYLPDERMGMAFEEELDAERAALYVSGFLAPGSAVPTGPLVAEVLATDPEARAGLARSVAEGRFADETAVLKEVRQPIAVLHGAEERFVSLEYLRSLTVPTLWRGAVQVVPGAGHAVHLDRPDALAALLGDFIAELPQTGVRA
ncbi:alpha/beta hydrolase [Streptomyces tremellae]|uniref:Alpha/beta hydrolase n=1 Tax=Streptomyces tremellae TaxID=1124239 RepID=A0ABP7G1K8_9ACTN